MGKKKGAVADARFDASEPRFEKISRKANKKSKARAGGGAQKEEKPFKGKGDARFAAAHKSPKFLTSRSSVSTKITLDERFKSVLTDERFKSLPGEGEIDKYGRKVRKREAKEMDEFYKVASDQDDDDDDDDGGNSNADGDGSSKHEEEGEPSDSDGSSVDDGKITFDSPEERIAYLNAVARGEIELPSEDDSSTSGGSYTDQSDDDDDDESLEEGGVGEDDDEVIGVLSEKVNAETVENLETKFLAFQNFDWESVRAVDIYVLITSFTSPGSVKTVEIFPSDYGIERMDRDARLGPQGLWVTKEGGSEGSSEGGSKDGDDSDEREDAADEESEEGSDSGDISDVDMLPGEESENKSDFDPEKLRRYEASKMKYYFAVVTFSSHDAANDAYKELDGLELEHSSIPIDIRAIPPADLDGVRDNRDVHDFCNAIPSTYKAPNFISKALQQTNIECSWEAGDDEREKKLTKWGVGNETWKAMAEGDDLKAYLASDSESSDESSDGDSDSSSEGSNEPRKGAQGGAGRTKRSKKAQRKNNLRSLLLGEAHEGDGGSGRESESESDRGSDGDSDSDGKGGDGRYDVDGAKSMTISRGTLKLQEKLKEKRESKLKEDMTPYEKYQQKRKEKKKQRRAAVKAKKGAEEDLLEDDGEEVPEWAKGGDGGIFDDDDGEEESNFFIENHDDNDNDNGNDGVDSKGEKNHRRKPKNHKKKNKDDWKDERNNGAVDKVEARKKASKSELRKLFEDGTDDENDFDMRGIERIEKMKHKKLTKARKKKEDRKAKEVVGTNFKVKTNDDRFAAVFDGVDDNFGIDKTNPSFRDTEAMKDILEAQSKNRKKRKRKGEKNGSSSSNVIARVGLQGQALGGGAGALSSLVSSLKGNIAKRETKK